MAIQARHGPQLVEARKVNVGFKVNRQVGRGSEAVFLQSKLLPNNRMQATPKAGFWLGWVLSQRCFVVRLVASAKWVRFSSGVLVRTLPSIGLSLVARLMWRR